MILGSIGPLIIASQRVRPQMAGLMTGFAKQSRIKQKNWITSLLSLLAVTTKMITHLALGDADRSSLT
jgi:hypothetical protein